MMSIRRSTIIITVLALGLAPAPALATTQNVTATHAYIAANYALARAGVAKIAPAQAKIEQLNGVLANECPLVGAGSPENEASQPIAHEVAVALWSVAYGTAAGPIRTFSGAARSLRFSNPAITRAARRYARELNELASISLPPSAQTCAPGRRAASSSSQPPSSPSFRGWKGSNRSRYPHGCSPPTSVGPTPASSHARSVWKRGSRNMNSWSDRPTGSRCSGPSDSTCSGSAAARVVGVRVGGREADAGLLFVGFLHEIAARGETHQSSVNLYQPFVEMNARCR